MARHGPLSGSSKSHVPTSRRGGRRGEGERVRGEVGLVESFRTAPEMRRLDRLVVLEFNWAIKHNLGSDLQVLLAVSTTSSKKVAKETNILTL